MSKNEIYNEDYFEGKIKEGYAGYTPERFLGYFTILAYCLHRVIRPNRMLDIGCAKGFLVLSFHRLGVESHGIDISSYAISNSSHCVRDRIICLDVEKDRLPFPDNYFDLVCMLQVIEHLQNFDLPLKEIRRVLRQDGFLFLTTPNNIRENRNAIHVNIHSSSSWTTILEDYGFSLDYRVLGALGQQVKIMKKEFVNQMRKRIKYAHRPASSKLEGVLYSSKITKNILANIAAWLWFTRFHKALSKENTTIIFRIINLLLGDFYRTSIFCFKQAALTSEKVV